MFLLYTKSSSTSQNTKTVIATINLWISDSITEKPCTFNDLYEILESGALILFKDDGLINGDKHYCNNVFLVNSTNSGYECHIIAPYSNEYTFSANQDNEPLIFD